MRAGGGAHVFHHDGQAALPRLTLWRRELSPLTCRPLPDLPQEGVRSLFTTTDKLPFRGPGAGGAGLDTAALKLQRTTFTESLMRLLPQMSFSEVREEGFVRVLLPRGFLEDEG